MKKILAPPLVLVSAMFAPTLAAQTVESSHKELPVIEELPVTGAATVISDSQEQIKFRGEGEYHPIADNNTDQGRTQNRQVEITINNIEA